MQKQNADQATFAETPEKRIIYLGSKWNEGIKPTV